MNEEFRIENLFNGDIVGFRNGMKGLVMLGVRETSMFENTNENNKDYILIFGDNTGQDNGGQNWR